MLLSTGLEDTEGYITILVGTKQIYIVLDELLTENGRGVDYILVLVDTSSVG